MVVVYTVAHANQGESFIYGLNGTIGTNQPQWYNDTSEELKEKLYLNEISYNGQDEPIVSNTFIPGNVMLKAYTTYGLGDDVNNPTDLVLAPSTINLTTNYENGSTFQSITARVFPEGSDSELV